VKDGKLVYLTDDDFEAAEEDGYRTIEVLDFVPHDEIDPIVFNRSYYLGPADGAEKVYALLVRALEESGLSAIARYVFHDKQQLGCLRVREGVITLENMYFADEIRTAKGIAPKGQRVDAKELDMARSLIDRFTSQFDHDKYEDEYREKLLAVVRRKQKGEEIHAAPREKEKDEAPDLMEALRASVEASKSSGNGRKKAGRPRRRRKTGAKK
jgi:DNA end-binding protein Ku